MDEIAAAVALLLDHGLTHVAVEKEARAVLGKPFQDLAEIRVAEGLAGFEQRPVRRKNLRCAWARGEDRRNDGEEISLKCGQRESSARGAHRRLDQALHRQPAELLMHGENAGHHARRGARANADVELLLDRSEIGVDVIEVDVAWGPALARRLGEEIEQGDAVASSPSRHEEAAAAW